MPRQFNDLSPNARVVALIHMDGAFVARVGTHAVGVRDGLVFDNDTGFGTAINAAPTGVTTDQPCHTSDSTAAGSGSGSSCASASASSSSSGSGSAAAPSTAGA